MKDTEKMEIRNWKKQNLNLNAFLSQGRARRGRGL